MVENKNNRPSQAAIAFGVLLILIGVAHLLDRLIPYEVWAFIGSAVRGAWSIVWPLALVAIGIYVLWAAKKGKLSSFKVAHANGSLRRSRTDKRILGVCGGIAYYFGVDSTVVRVIAVVLMLVLAPTVVIAYFILALLIPSE